MRDGKEKDVEAGWGSDATAQYSHEHAETEPPPPSLSDRDSIEQEVLTEKLERGRSRQERKADPYEEVRVPPWISLPLPLGATRRSFASSRRTKLPPPPPAPVPVSDLDNGVVGWESQDDPEMPMNFSAKRKWTIVGFVAAITFLTPFASTILAPAIGFLAEDFRPLFLSPLSEIYGRHVVLSSANAFFCVWLIGCALAPSLNALIVFRFLTGVGGSGCLTIGGGIIADIIPVHQRGRAITIWMLGPLIGPTIGPLIGAFVAQDIGWRWTGWIVLAASVPMVVAIAILSQETNARVLIQRKTDRLRIELNRPDLRSVYVDANAPPQSKSMVLARGLTRPLKMLFLSPLLFSLSLYIAFCYGVLYLLFNTIPLVFQDQYGFSLGMTGLVYIPMGVGYGVSLALFNYISDRTVIRLTAANHGVYEPEMRLPDCVYFACLLPLTFFWYGWSAYAQVHWISPILALLPFGLGLVGVWQPIQAYIIDAFPEYAASALAAFTVFRSVVAAFLPLAGPKMYDALGLGWGNSLLGFVAIALIPVPALICKYGARFRAQKLNL
ncbi:fluconazole resistance protein [Verticillium alfalfae VaMs.102]|uniref:Fluconazole resistance protein n=1 Tax=Verticillium alfalfae (strain VaMs.102 / ATCC MYA-4576 / FGSC 10136) TaxID=526221 RepID=C9S7V3_VERA1|nr:fluconazole resistance protein [Verticillium alfalfae VaMs.102]EEY14838.1 fluconazole resistance protein [Verticillium alfalfae VaMs.102]